MITVYSPLDVWVVQLSESEGANVKAGQPVLQLDASVLERELLRQKNRLELNKITAERLTDDYLETYIWPPIRELVKVRAEETAFREEYLASAKDLAAVGEVPDAGSLREVAAGRP